MPAYLSWLENPVHTRSVIGSNPIAGTKCNRAICLNCAIFLYPKQFGLPDFRKNIYADCIYFEFPIGVIVEIMNQFVALLLTGRALFCIIAPLMMLQTSVIEKGRQNHESARLEGHMVLRCGNGALGWNVGSYR